MVVNCKEQTMHTPFGIVDYNQIIREFNKYNTNSKVIEDTYDEDTYDIVLSDDIEKAIETAIAQAKAPGQAQAQAPGQAKAKAQNQVSNPFDIWFLKPAQPAPAPLAPAASTCRTANQNFATPTFQLVQCTTGGAKPKKSKSKRTKITKKTKTT